MPSDVAVIPIDVVAPQSVPSATEVIKDGLDAKYERNVYDGIPATATWLVKKFLIGYPLVKYNQNSGKWFYYDGNVWQEDLLCIIHKEFVNWSMGQYNNAAKLDTREARELVDLLKRINNKPEYIDSAMRIQVPILNSSFDPDGDFLNCKDKAVNLRTWEVTEHHQNDMCKSIANANYNVDAKCPKWIAHLNLCFGGNVELTLWFQVFCGYLIRLGNPNQLFTIWYGPGQNGKSVCINVISYVLGTYSHTTSPKTFESKRDDSDTTRANPGLCDCMGKRFISCPEAKDGAVLDSSVVKVSTGGDTIESRYLNENTFRFKILGAIVYSGNHKPVIRDTTVGMWRRLKLVPFQHIIQDKDRVLEYEKQLYPEADGILQWMLQGLIKYDELKGFPVCELIEKETATYKLDNDVVGQYIEQHCITKNKDSEVLMEAVVADCLSFAEEVGVRISKKRIRARLLELGHCKSDRTQKGYMLKGITISNPHKPIKTEQETLES